MEHGMQCVGAWIFRISLSLGRVIGIYALSAYFQPK